MTQSLLFDFFLATNRRSDDFFIYRFLIDDKYLTRPFRAWYLMRPEVDEFRVSGDAQVSLHRKVRLCIMTVCVELTLCCSVFDCYVQSITSWLTLNLVYIRPSLSCPKKAPFRIN